MRRSRVGVRVGVCVAAAFVCYVYVSLRRSHGRHSSIMGGGSVDLSLAAVAWWRGRSDYFVPEDLIYDAFPNDINMSNFGMCKEGTSCEHSKSQRDMYHTLLGLLDPLPHKPNVLEIGCGRGGGSQVLQKTLQPNTLLSIDKSTYGVDWAREHWPANAHTRYQIDRFPLVPHAKLPDDPAAFCAKCAPGEDGVDGGCHDWCSAQGYCGHTVKFQHVDCRTGDTPKEEPAYSAPFDVIVSVEVGGYFPNEEQAGDIVRALRPGGVYLEAHLHTPAQHKEHNAYLMRTGLHLEASLDVTADCVRALLDPSREKRMRELVPRLLVPFVKESMRFPGTANYETLVNGELRYVLYAWRL